MLLICTCGVFQNVFMFVDNTEYYGYLINSEDFDTTLHSNNDLWQMFTNAYVSTTHPLHSTTVAQTCGPKQLCYCALHVHVRLYTYISARACLLCYMYMF